VLQRAIETVLAIALLACSDPTGPRSDILTVAHVPTGLMFRNSTSEAVYWMAFDTETLPLIGFLLCIEPLSCRSVPPQATQLVTLKDLPCCTRDTREVTIFHYHLVPASGGGFRPDSVRSLGVRL
jgi:hypothetical protein